MNAAKVQRSTWEQRKRDVEDEEQWRNSAADWYRYLRHERLSSAITEFVTKWMDDPTVVMFAMEGADTAARYISQAFWLDVFDPATEAEMQYVREVVPALVRFHTGEVRYDDETSSTYSISPDIE